MKGGSLYGKYLDPVSSFKHCTIPKGKNTSQNIPPEIFLSPLVNMKF